MKNKSYIDVAIIIGSIVVLNQIFIKVVSQGINTILLYLLVYVFPIFITYMISRMNSKTKNILEFLMNIFSSKERTIALVFALICIGLYYCICLTLNNYDFSNVAYIVMLCYIPWIMLQEDLIELEFNEKG